MKNNEIPVAAPTATEKLKSNAQTQDIQPQYYSPEMLESELPGNCPKAAHWWHEFGFTVIPICPNEKHPACQWQPWLDKLNHDPISKHWGAKPNHELGAVLDHSLIVFDADSKESLAALYILEKEFDKTPNLVVKTKKGEHHFFKRATGTYAITKGYATKKDATKIDVKTGRSETDGRSIVVLAPSTDKTILTNEADNAADLVEADQDFIDAVFEYNGEQPPRLPEPKVIQEYSNRAGKHEVAEILSYIDADIDYSPWVTVLMGAHKHFNGAEIGLHIVDAWSATGTNYAGSEVIEYKWRSFTLDGGVTFASVCDMAKKAGADLAEIKKKYDENGDPNPTFEELLKLAKNMAGETKSCDIEQAIIDANKLNAIDANKIEQQIKNSTGITQAVISDVKRKNKRNEMAEFNKSYGLPTPAFEKMPINHFIDTKFNMAEGNKPLATIPNIKAMLDYYSITAVYDVIKKKPFYNIPNSTGTADNRDNRAITTCISLAKLNEIPSDIVPDFIFAIADSNPRNPVAEWITLKEWDGKDRIQSLCDTLRPQAAYPVQLRDILVKRWLISAVAAALMPKGFKARGVLTLQGNQSIGKTSWLESLVPNLALREHVVKTDHLLDPSDKDSVMSAISHWLVELGELDSTFKKDIARLKGFITAAFDKFRRPYGRVDSEYQRRTVFFASVNDGKFLVDHTGNTRFWTIAVDSIDYKHSIDMQQLWAQAASLFNAGEIWWLTDSEETLLEETNKGHRVETAVKEIILCFYNFDCKVQSSYTKKSASEVLRDIGYDKPTNPQSREAGRVLRELIGEPTTIKGVSKWKIPPAINKFTFDN